MSKTTEQWMAEALAHMKQATWPPEKWCGAIQDGYAGHEYDWMVTHNYKAQQAMWNAAHPGTSPQPVPPPVPSPHNFFAGKGIFTTSEPSAASHPCDWYAVQADPEGNLGYANAPGSRRCYWMARPTAEMVKNANDSNTPFIAQAESQPELEKALALGTRITVPKALVGNPTSWSPQGFASAVSQGWELILEWYWNAQENYTQPDAANYPYFTNVCFGIYSEGEPGGQGYVPQSKTVADYRQVWHGSFSVWKAEAMTPADWVAFEA